MAARIVVGAAYDAIGFASGLAGQRIVVGKGLLKGHGVVTSPIDEDEIRSTDRPWPAVAGRLTLAWAGRLAEGKGLETLLTALVLTPSGTFLHVLGDGPNREAFVRQAEELGVTERVTWHGYVADRRAYLDLLASADLFVFPSPAEGFPKVVLDAMAAGLPVIASSAGTVTELSAAGLVKRVPTGDPAALMAAIQALEAQPTRAKELRQAGLAFAAAHTREVEAGNVVRLWQAALRSLPWSSRPRG